MGGGGFKHGGAVVAGGGGGRRAVGEVLGALEEHYTLVEREGRHLALGGARGGRGGGAGRRRKIQLGPALMSFSIRR